MFKKQKDLYKFISVLFEQIGSVRNLHTIEIKGYTRRDIDEIIYQCIKAEYILKVEAYRDANGTPHFDAIGMPCVSISGYQFLNSLRSDIALEKARKADIKGWISLVISILTFLIYVLEQLDVIRPFIETMTTLLK